MAIRTARLELGFGICVLLATLARMVAARRFCCFATTGKHLSWRRGYGEAEALPDAKTRSEDGIMAFLDRPFRLTCVLLAGSAFAGLARAADYAAYPPAHVPPPRAGVPCDVGWAGWHTLLPAWWTSAWLGHFSGGLSHYDYDRGEVALIWGDEKRCFPSSSACYAWVSTLRRKFHRPEGYWTCLPLR
jgi:hypothetical protein